MEGKETTYPYRRVGVRCLYHPPVESFSLAKRRTMRFLERLAMKLFEIFLPIWLILTFLSWGMDALHSWLVGLF